MINYRKYEDVDEWHRYNQYIKTGYRQDLGCNKSCKTLCGVHNDTVNIWSHLLAFIAVIVCILQETKREEIRLPVILYLLSASACFFTSFTFHLFLSVNLKVAKSLRQLDFIGINLLISGSIGPLIFYCFPKWSILTYVYLSTEMLMMLIRGWVFVFRINQASTIIATSLFTTWFSILPLVHIVLLNPGYLWVFVNVSLMGLCYMSGVLIYYLEFPEASFKHIKFDIFGSSHQLWHFCVIVACFIQYYTLNLLAKNM